MVEEKPNAVIEAVEKKPNEIEVKDEELNEFLASTGITTNDTLSVNETFFIGGDNWYFEQQVKNFRSQGNEMFINFLLT